MERDIENALAGAIRAAAGLTPIYWPNLPGPDAPQPPFVSVQIVRFPRSDKAIAGGSVALNGRIVLTLAWPEGKGHGPANDAADAIAVEFPRARRITAGARTIVIKEAPDVREGRPVAGRWEQQIVIDYQA